MLACPSTPLLVAGSARPLGWLRTLSPIGMAEPSPPQ